MAKDVPPLVDDDGEVRELTAVDLRTFERGAPWTRPPAVAAREPLRAAIAALERARGTERERVAGSLRRLRAELKTLEEAAEVRD